jgi:hypothetical protein
MFNKFELFLKSILLVAGIHCHEIYFLFLGGAFSVKLRICNLWLRRVVLCLTLII